MSPKSSGVGFGSSIAEATGTAMAEMAAAMPMLMRALVRKVTPG